MFATITNLSITQHPDGTISGEFFLTGKMSEILWTLDFEGRNWQLQREAEAIARKTTGISNLAIDFVDVDAIEYVSKVDGLFTFKIKAPWFLENPRNLLDD